MEIQQSVIRPVIQTLNLFSDVIQKVNSLLRLRVSENKITFSLCSTSGLFYWQQDIYEPEPEYTTVFPVQLFSDYLSLYKKGESIKIEKGKIKFSNSSVHEFETFRIQPPDERPYINLINEETPLMSWTINKDIMQMLYLAHNFTGKSSLGAIRIQSNRIIASDHSIACILHTDMEVPETLYLPDNVFRALDLQKCEEFTLHRYPSFSSGISIYHMNVNGIHFVLPESNFQIEDLDHSSKRKFFDHNLKVRVSRSLLYEALQRMLVSTRMNDDTKVLLKIDKGDIVLENKFANRASERVLTEDADMELNNLSILLSCDYLKTLVSEVPGDYLDLYLSREPGKPILIKDIDGSIEFIQATVR